MTPEPTILDHLDRTALTDLCRRWQITEFSLFGSALRADFHADSDVDVLITFADSARYGFFALSRLQQELEELLGRTVDIVTRRTIERSRNRIRRESILGSLRPIYVA